MNHHSSSFLDLPSEVLLKIFNHLRFDDIISIQQVDDRLDKLVVILIWQPHLRFLTKNNKSFTQDLEKLGWSNSCSDYDIIKIVWTKLNCPKRWENEPKVTDELIFLHTPVLDSGHMKVSNCVIYEDKIFLSMHGGNVHSRSLEDFSVLSYLHNKPMEVRTEDPVLLCTPMALYGSIVAVSVSSEDRLYLWNAQTENLFTTLRIPSRCSRIYDLRINATHIVCLASWSLIVWTYKSKDGFFEEMLEGPVIAHDFYDQPTIGQVNIWFESHNIEMNENYVITHASQPIMTSFQNPPGLFNLILKQTFWFSSTLAFLLIIKL